RAGGLEPLEPAMAPRHRCDRCDGVPQPEGAVVSVGSEYRCAAGSFSGDLYPERLGAGGATFEVVAVALMAPYRAGGGCRSGCAVGQACLNREPEGDRLLDSRADS